MNDQIDKYYYGVDTSREEDAIKLANDEYAFVELCHDGKLSTAWEATRGEVIIVSLFKNKSC